MTAKKYVTKRVFGQEQVLMKHADGGETFVVLSAFEGVWKQRGWTLVETKDSEAPTPATASTKKEQS